MSNIKLFFLNFFNYYFNLKYYFNFLWFFSSPNSPTVKIMIVESYYVYRAICIFLFWLKARVSYYVNNWVYTTNHKRIAVNYFWFIILSGIIGMVLATVIRLELAYPGVGVFAGDSLQYLSMVTAHAVIMVFFMIMPLIFGAFANFLLPTQLGVHDVAFPRLNSAAFWFVPAGLLMLGQLVCIDRRYQRMNCFNVREVQSLLKRKFFHDLVISTDYHTLLNNTIINLRYKTNNLSAIDSNSFLLNQNGISYQLSSRFMNFQTFEHTTTTRQTFFLTLLDYTPVITFIENLNNCLFFFSLKTTDAVWPDFKLLLARWYLEAFLVVSVLYNFMVLQVSYLYLNYMNTTLYWRWNFWSWNFWYHLVEVFFSFFKLNLILWIPYMIGHTFDKLIYNLVELVSHNTGVLVEWVESLNGVFTFANLQLYLTNFLLINFYHISNINSETMYYTMLYKKTLIHTNDLFVQSNDVFFWVRWYRMIKFMVYEWINLFLNVTIFSIVWLNSLIDPTTLLNFNSFKILTFNGLIYNESIFDRLVVFFWSTFNPFFDTIYMIFFGLSTSTIFQFFYFLNLREFIGVTTISSPTLLYNTESLNADKAFENISYSHFEANTNNRFLEAHNPIFKYDYKTGDFFPKQYKVLHNHMYTTMLHLSGTQHSLWFFADSFKEVFSAPLTQYLTDLTRTVSLEHALFLPNNNIIYTLTKECLNHNDIFFFFLIH